MNNLFDSDCAYLPLLYKDLFINDGLYSNWYGSAAPYYFPDMFLYFISNFIFTNYYYAIPFYFTINAILIIYALYKINRLFFSSKNALYLSTISFSLIYLIPQDVYIYQFTTVFHFGEFVIGLFSLYFILKIIQNSTNKIYYILLLLVSTLTVASDNMYILHFILPTLASVLILWANKHLTNKQLIVIYSLLIFSVILGKLLGKVLTINPSEYASLTKLSLVNLSTNVQSIVAIFKNSYHTHTFITTLITIVYILTAFLLLFYKRINRVELNDQTKSSIFFFSFFLLFMVLGNLMALSLLYPHPVNPRYMITIFLLPLLTLPILLKWIRFDQYIQLSKIISFITLLTFIYILLFKSYHILKNNTLKSEYYPPLVSCVDSFIKEHQAIDGVAGYWESKSINLLSKEAVNISQINHDLSKSLWVNTNTTYKDSYDFALIRHNSIDKKKILKLNGKPTKIHKCQDSEIIYYKEKFNIAPSQF